MQVIWIYSRDRITFLMKIILLIIFPNFDFFIFTSSLYLFYNVCLEKGSQSSNQLFYETIYTIYLSLCTLTADTNSPSNFRGTHCV